jgi:hypothetical protein
MKRCAVIVYWRDTVTNNHGWRDASDLGEWADKHAGGDMISCGVLVAKTKDYIIVTPLYNPEDDMAGIIVKIPMGCVQKIVRIKI